MSDEASCWRATKGKDGKLTWERVKPYDQDKAFDECNPIKKGRAYYAVHKRIQENKSLTKDEGEMLVGVGNHVIKDLQDWHIQCSGQIRRELNDAGAGVDSSRQFAKSTETFCSTASKLETTFLTEHEQTIEEAGNKRATMNLFKRENNLLRDARYPESKVLHFAVLFVILAAEGLLNAIFFSDNPYGWLGGLIPASTIAAVNVGVCFIAGRLLLPQLNLNSWGILKGGGLILLLVCVAFVIALHLAAAHLREAMQQNDGVDYLRSLAFDPRTLQDTLSLALIGLGLVASVIAAIDGYTYDDPYPGYGKVYREWKILNDKVFKQLMNYKLAVNDAYNTAVQEIRVIPESYDVTEKSLKKFEGDIATYFACVGSYYSQAKGVAKALITTFRKEVEDLWEASGSFPVSDDLVNSALPSPDPAGLKDEVQKQLDDYFRALQQLRDRYTEESQQAIDKLGTEREKWMGAQAMKDTIAAMLTRIDNGKDQDKKDQDSKPASGDGDSRGGLPPTATVERDA